MQPPSVQQSIVFSSAASHRNDLSGSPHLSNQNNSTKTMQNAAIASVAAENFARMNGPNAGSFLTANTKPLIPNSPAAECDLSDIKDFLDWLESYGGIKNQSIEIASESCQNLLEVLEGKSFQQASNDDLDAFVIIMQKMIYWVSKKFITVPIQRIFDLFFKFCGSPQIYKKLPGETLVKMISILGTLAKEEHPVDKILADLNPELNRISKIGWRMNWWVPNTLIAMSRLGCFTPERAEMFNTLIYSLEAAQPLNKLIKGEDVVESEFKKFIQQHTNDNSSEKQHFVRVVNKIINDWSRRKTTIPLPLPLSQQV